MRIVLALMLLAAGCGSRHGVGPGDAGFEDPDAGGPDAGARMLFADSQYATRCDMTLGCAGTIDHDVCGFDESDSCVEGDPQASLSCGVTESAGTRTIGFRLGHVGGDFSLEVQGLTVPLGGGSAMGGACRVTVVEGESTYAGACGGAAPSPEQPCQITDVQFVDDAGNPTFRGNLFCQFLENQASPALQIEVTTVGLGSVPASTPGRFRVVNCPGLAL